MANCGWKQFTILVELISVRKNKHTKAGCGITNLLLMNENNYIFLTSFRNFGVPSWFLTAVGWITNNECLCQAQHLAVYLGVFQREYIAGADVSTACFVQAVPTSTTHPSKIMKFEVGPSVESAVRFSALFAIMVITRGGVLLPELRIFFRPLVSTLLPWNTHTHSQYKWWPILLQTILTWYTLLKIIMESPQLKDLFCNKGLLPHNIVVHFDINNNKIGNIHMMIPNHQSLNK